MDPEFWHRRWNNNDIGFHRDDIHDQLIALWPSLKLTAGSPVFVPLCGKSNDMAWLAERGHSVLGVELSERAIDDFFANHNLTPEVERRDDFVIKRAAAYELWCGDLFEMPESAFTRIKAVYDRASLVALPPDLKKRYAKTLIAGLTKETQVLLISLDYDQSEMTGPPFATPLHQIRELFENDFDITELHTSNVLSANPPLRKRGLSALTETTYLMRRREL